MVWWLVLVLFCFGEGLFFVLVVSWFDFIIIVIIIVVLLPQLAPVISKQM